MFGVYGEGTEKRRFRDMKSSVSYHDPGPNASGIGHNTNQSLLSVGDGPCAVPQLLYAGPAKQKFVPH